MSTHVFTEELSQYLFLGNVKLFSLPSEKVSTLSSERESKSFPYRVDPFSEGTWCAVKQSRSHIHKLSPLAEMAENLPFVFSHHNHQEND